MNSCVCFRDRHQTGPYTVGNVRELTFGTDWEGHVEHTRTVQSEMTGGLEALFGKHGLADMMDKVCQELGIDSVEDLGYVEKKHVDESCLLYR
jgi:hypothetical protein